MLMGWRIERPASNGKVSGVTLCQVERCEQPGCLDCFPGPATYTRGSNADCSAAPNCSKEHGCLHGFDELPVEWVINFEHQEHGRGYLAQAWRHPRSDVVHRSAVGVPVDKAPKWAR